VVVVRWATFIFPLGGVIILYSHKLRAFFIAGAQTCITAISKCLVRVPTILANSWNKESLYRLLKPQRGLHVVGYMGTFKKGGLSSQVLQRI